MSLCARIFLKPFEIDELTDVYPQFQIFSNMQHPPGSHACPLCKTLLAAKSRTSKHLYRHCSVINNLPLEEAKKQVNLTLQAIEQARFNTTKTRCDCEIKGTFICDRLVSLIDWLEPITLVHVQVQQKKSLKIVDYFRYNFLITLLISIKPSSKEREKFSVFNKKIYFCKI